MIANVEAGTYSYGNPREVVSTLSWWFLYIQPNIEGKTVYTTLMFNIQYIQYVEYPTYPNLCYSLITCLISKYPRSVSPTTVFFATESCKEQQLYSMALVSPWWPQWHSSGKNIIFHKPELRPFGDHFPYGPWLQGSVAVSWWNLPRFIIQKSHGILVLYYHPRPKIRGKLYTKIPLMLPLDSLKNNRKTLGMFLKNQGSWYSCFYL